jgi:predicted nuclease of restriction endonuclease-like RecB superfamily
MRAGSIVRSFAFGSEREISLLAMLTTDLVPTRTRGPFIEPRWIDPAGEGNLRLAEDLIGIFAGRQGDSRGALRDALDVYAGDRVDYRVQRGLAKLLLDHFCEFEIRGAKPPEEIRRVVFELSRENHPILSRPNLLHPVSRADIIGLAAMKLELAPEQVEEGLYADLIEEHRLAKFDAPEPRALLERYNVALAQAMLYRCSELRLSVYRNIPARYKQLFKFIKFYRLIHSINGDLESGYEVVLDGPASMFRNTGKYGLQMALFLPALLLCTRWKMRADIRPAEPGQKTREFVLDSECGLVSHYKHKVEYDSLLEETFAKRFEAAKTEWSLERETEIVDLKETVMIPDFAFHHPDGRTGLLEIVGFWRPDYLRRKIEKLAKAGRRDLIVAVSTKLNVVEEDFAETAGPVFFFKERIQPKDVLERLEKLEPPAAG